MKYQVEKIAFAWMFTFLIFSITTPASLQSNGEIYTVEIYNHDTGEFLGSLETTRPPTIGAENLIKMLPIAAFEWNDLGGMIGINTTSDALRIELDTDDKRLYVQVSGSDNTKGEFALFVSPNLVSAPENVEVYLDNLPVENFTVETASDWIVIYAEYTHSIHVLTFEVSPGVPTIWYTQLPNLALISLAIVAVIVGVAVYWFKFRRRAA